MAYRGAEVLEPLEPDGRAGDEERGRGAGQADRSHDDGVDVVGSARCSVDGAALVGGCGGREVDDDRSGRQVVEESADDVVGKVAGDADPGTLDLGEPGSGVRVERDVVLGGPPCEGRSRLRVAQHELVGACLDERAGIRCPDLPAPDDGDAHGSSSIQDQNNPSEIID
ncbi:hypothetical protein LP422_24045 [Janibacter limosus]|nr:hypothetical protein LP422_24045 [Janibacter limosus]